MTKEIICTICSREKDKSKELLPAYKRYLSSRITAVKKIADDMGIPFFILSGKYGLISADEKTSYYDHLLVFNEVDKMSDKVKGQIESFGINKITFYKKRGASENWNPYVRVIERAANVSGVELVVLDYIE